MWTYQQVKSADKALSPAIPDPGLAATALNAQTVQATALPVSVAAIHGVLLLSGEWLAIEALAGVTFSPGWPGTPSNQDRAVAAAKLAIELAQSQVETIQPEKWTGFMTFLGALQAASAISTGSITAINALAFPSTTVPTWQPAVTAGDIQTARAQP